ncbi:MAG TPA: glycosyltransferase family 87 protein, partial [Vicinamibacterales bacterium]
MRLRSTLLLLIAVAALVLLFHERVTRKMPDLEVYWTAAVRARAAEPLYRVSDQHYQFKYLPAFAVLAIPLGLLPLGVAKIVWLLASVALVVALLLLSVRLLPEKRRPVWLLVGATIVVMGKFYAHEIVLGQMNALFAVVVALAALALRDAAEARGGLLVSLAIVIKPYAVLFLPWLAARRRLASIGAAVAGLALVLAMPALLYGVDGNIALHRAWWRTVADSTAPNLTN